MRKKANTLSIHLFNKHQHVNMYKKGYFTLLSPQSLIHCCCVLHNSALAQLIVNCYKHVSQQRPKAASVVYMSVASNSSASFATFHKIWQILTNLVAGWDKPAPPRSTSNTCGQWITSAEDKRTEDRMIDWCLCSSFFINLTIMMPEMWFILDLFPLRFYWDHIVT